MNLLLYLLLTGCDSETGVNAVKESTPPPPPPPDGDAIDVPPSFLATTCKPLGPESYVYNTKEGGFDATDVAAIKYNQQKYSTTAGTLFGSVDNLESGNASFNIFLESAVDDDDGSTSSQIFIFPETVDLQSWFEDEFTLYVNTDMQFDLTPNRVIPTSLALGCRIYFNPAFSMRGISYLATDFSTAFVKQPNFNIETDDEKKDIFIKTDTNQNDYYSSDSDNGYIFTNTLDILNLIYNDIGDTASLLATYESPNLFDTTVYRGAYHCTPTDGTPKSGCHEIVFNN